MNIIDAASATVHDYPGGSESLAPRVPLSAAVLRSKVDPRSDSQYLSIAEADRIMRLTGDFRMLRALAHQHGFLVVESPDPGASGSEMEVFEQMVSSRVASGEFAPRAHAARAIDKRIGEKEFRATLAAEHALQAVVAKMA